MNPSSSKPSERWAHSMAYDSTNDRVVLFGGFVSGSYDDETWVYSDKKLFQQGLFSSKVKVFDSISTITGELNWTHLQPLDSSLMVQIGFSTSPNDADFNYMPWHTINFTFEFHTKYLRFRALFESSSDTWQPVSPFLNMTFLSYTLESIFSDDDGSDNTIPSDYWVIPAIIGALVSCVATLGIIGIVFYSKNPEKLKKISRKLRNR